MDKGINKLNNTIFILTTILSIFGTISIGDLRIFGMVITPYRIIIPILFLICAIGYLNNLKCSNNEFKILNRNIIAITGIFIIWIIYGTVQLFVIDGLNMTNGVKELFEICLGYAIVISLFIVIARGVSENIVINTIKTIYMAIALFAVIEIASGYHLPTSIYADTEATWILSTTEHNITNATAIFYNPNDLAAFMAIFTPIFFYSRNLIERIVNIIVIVMTLSVLRLNDAWIALFAVIISLVIFAAICIINIIRKTVHSNGKLNYDACVALISVVVGYVFGFKLLLFFRKCVHSLFEIIGIDLGVVEETNISVSGISETIDAQLISGTGNSGSSRIDTYIDMLQDTFVDSYGLGFGPDGYSHYVKTNMGSDILVNPHCLWLEILSQYGVIIFGIIIIAIVYLYISLFKIFIKHNALMALILFLIDTSFVFAVFGPSTFLGYGYSWVVIGLSAGYVARYKLKNQKQVGATAKCD